VKNENGLNEMCAVMNGWRANALLGVTTAFAGVIVAANIDWMLRPYVVLACLIAAPGWAIGGLVKLEDRALAVSIGIAMGLSVNILVALAMVELGAWHPEAAAATILETSAAVLLVRAAVTRSRDSDGSPLDDTLRSENFEQHGSS
jgi:hypothetical protein